MRQGNNPDLRPQNGALCLPAIPSTLAPEAIEKTIQTLSSIYKKLANASALGAGEKETESRLGDSSEHTAAGENRAAKGRVASRVRNAEILASLSGLEQLEARCAKELALAQQTGGQSKELSRIGGKVMQYALNAFLRTDPIRRNALSRGAPVDLIDSARGDLVKIFQERGAHQIAVSLSMAQARIQNRQLSESFVEDRQVALFATKKLASFLVQKRESNSVTISPLDGEFLDLLANVGTKIQSVRAERLKRSRETTKKEDLQPTAHEALKAIGIAADIMLACHAIQKMQGARPSLVVEHGGSIEPVRDGLQLPVKGREIVFAELSAEFMAAIEKLPSCVDTATMRGITSSVSTSREALLFRASGCIDIFDRLLISCQDAAAQLASISSGSAPLNQGDSVPNPRLTEVLLKFVMEKMKSDPRAVPNPEPLKMSELLVSVQRMIEFVDQIGDLAQVGGILVGGLHQGCSHQVPRGGDPIAPVIQALSINSNGAHVGMTHFPKLETAVNQLIRKPGVLFERPWSEGVGIPTSGGTASNNLSTDLAFSSAGAGLALKRACEAHSIDLMVSVPSGKVSLRGMSNQRALMVHPESISGALRGLDASVIKALRDNFIVELKRVQEEYPPLVVIPKGEWVHYTLERYLVGKQGHSIVRLPMNAKTELDLSLLKEEVQTRFKDGPRPLILPMTFCNTGLGRAGCDAETLDQFMGWFSETYGDLPLMVVDAAQGGLTFGVARDCLAPEVYAAREALGRYAMSFTLDPHKSTLPVPCSVWMVKDPTWAIFATGRSVSHSYLKSSDATELREANQLSTPLESTFYTLKFLKNLESGAHNDIFKDVFRSAEDAFNYLRSHPTHVTVEGRRFRMVAPFEQHSGILGVCFVPVDGDMSMKAANDAVRKVREPFVEDRNSPLSCSSFTLDLSAFRSPTQIRDRFLADGLDWKDVKNLEFLRFVFGQRAQDRVVTEVLPALINRRFGA